MIVPPDGLIGRPIGTGNQCNTGSCLFQQDVELYCC